MSSMSDTAKWVSGWTGPMSQSDIRRERKKRNKKAAKLRQQQRQQERQQPQQSMPKQPEQALAEQPEIPLPPQRTEQPKKVECVAEIREKHHPDKASTVREDKTITQELEKRAIQRGPLPPIMQELPPTDGMVVLSQDAPAQNITAAAATPSTAADCIERAADAQVATAATADAVTTGADGLGASDEHLNVSGGSLETPAEDAGAVATGAHGLAVGDEHPDAPIETSAAPHGQLQKEPYTFVGEQAVEDRNNGCGDSPMGPKPHGQTTRGEPVDRYGPGVYVETDPDDELRRRRDWALWARQQEAQRGVGPNGPSFVQLRAACGIPQLPLYAPTQATYAVVNTTVPIVDRVALFAVSCGLSAELAPYLLPRMISAVYGEAYARSVTVMSAEAVEHMLAVFWQHEIAPFCVEEVRARLTPSFYNNGGGAEAFCYASSPSPHVPVMHPGLLPYYQCGGWDTWFGGMSPPYYLQGSAPGRSHPSCSSSPWGTY